MDKYTTPLIIDYSKSIPYYQTTILSSVPTEDIPFYYITQEGDRLDTIANLFYKTPNKWWVIAKANNLANGTIGLVGGTKLLIPNV
jgi:nucleoid-associated protein YgaU